MENEFRLNVRIPADLYLRFKAETALRGLIMSDLIRDMIEKWLAENARVESK